MGGQRYSPAALLPENSPGTHIIIILMSNNFIQIIYNYIPKSNHISTTYIVAALLYSQFVIHVITHVTSVLYFYISTFRSMCAVHSVTLFSSS